MPQFMHISPQKFSLQYTWEEIKLIYVCLNNILAAQHAFSTRSEVNERKRSCHIQDFMFSRQCLHDCVKAEEKL